MMGLCESHSSRKLSSTGSVDATECSFSACLSTKKGFARRTKILMRALLSSGPLVRAQARSAHSYIAQYGKPPSGSGMYNLELTIRLGFDPLLVSM